MNRTASRTARLLPVVLLFAGALTPAIPRAGKFAGPNGYALEVSAPDQGRVSLKISGAYRENTCLIETGKLQLRQSTATYRPPGDPTCRVDVRFLGAQARVLQKGTCGCGLNVNLSGSYKRTPDRMEKPGRQYPRAPR